MKNISAIILAAGMSTRMGKFKQLLPYKGTTVIEYILGQVVLAGLDPVILVTGHHAALITEEIKDSSVTIAYNPDYPHGMHTSVLAGIRKLPETIDAFMLFLGDQPEISREMIVQIVNAFTLSDKGILIPSYNFKGGHPIIIDAKFIAEVKQINEMEGLKGFIKNHSEDIEYLTFSQESILFDIDTPNDYEALKKRC